MQRSSHVDERLSGLQVLLLDDRVVLLNEDGAVVLLEDTGWMGRGISYSDSRRRVGE